MQPTHEIKNHISKAPPVNAVQEAAQATYPNHEKKPVDAKVSKLKDNNDNNEFLSSDTATMNRDKIDALADTAQDLNIGLSTLARKEGAEHLSILLADTYQLYLKTQNFHWNVTGHMFGELHSLFENQYQELATAIDEIAENIRQLGHPAPATFSAFQCSTTIEDTVGVQSAPNMIQALVMGHECALATARNVLAQSTQSQDQGFGPCRQTNSNA